MPAILFAIQLFSTLMMAGLIWFVQIVHYPLFARVGSQQFPAYAEAHARRTTFVVAPLMLAELVSSALFLFPSLRPLQISEWSTWVGAGLVAMVWLSTALLQVPLHNQLQRGFNAGAARSLTVTNWVRTLAWSLRAALVLSWTVRIKSF